MGNTDCEIQLKDGRVVRVRQIRSSDGPLFQTFFPGLSEQTRGYMHGWIRPGACMPEHAQSLAARSESSDHMAIAALASRQADERMVGYCWIDKLASEDAPILGIGIVDDYHEVGLGKHLLRLMLDEAGRRGFDRVWLGVWEDNARARHVYESVGFRPHPDRPPGEFDGRLEFYMMAPTQ